MARVDSPKACAAPDTSGGATMGNSAGGYVPFPILDQLYAQRSIGPTPFASEKARNARLEPATLVSIYDKRDSGESFKYRMTYPAALQAEQYPKTEVLPSRNTANFFQTAAPGLTVASGLSTMPVPNPYWQIPPATFENPSEKLEEVSKLPRDTLHPLLSALQASENQKAAAFNPLVSHFACASRKGPPCESHTVHPKTAVVVSQGSLSAGDDGGDGDGDDEGITTKVTVQKLGRASRKGDPKTAMGRAYCSEGGFHDPEQYSGKIIEFASAQPTTLTAIAAKALASALHDQSSLALPANVMKARQARPTPNSGLTGTNSNRFEFAGVHNPTATIVPPSPSFRQLSGDVKSILSTRRRDTRHALAEALRKKFVPLQPPPCAIPPAGEALLEEKALRQPDAGRYGNKADEDDVEEADYISDGDIDPIAAVGRSSALGIWNAALRRCGGRFQSCDALSTTKEHPSREVVVNKNLRILTTQLISAYSSGSVSAQFERYLGGVGIRMEDTLAQTKPPSQSSFADGLSKLENTKQFSNIPITPNNTFGFDNARLSMLLAEKGSEVEEIFFEGVQHIGNGTLKDIGNFCPGLRLLNLANSTQLTDDTVVHIVTRCRQLAYLNISGCSKLTGVSLAALFESCPNLHVLCASSLSLIDKTASVAFTGLFKTKQLAVLDLSFCENLTDDALTCVAQHCRALEILDLSGCVSLADVGVASIGSSCGLLKTWRLRLCTQLTEASLSVISLAPRNLLELDLAGCTSLTPPVFEGIVRHLPCLRMLSISGCTQLDDTAVASVTRYCRSLKSLNLSNCVGISLASCMELIHELQQLRRLVVSESTISNAEVVMLSSLRESCKIVRNQFRPQPVVKRIAYKAIDEKKKKAPPPKKGK